MTTGDRSWSALIHTAGAPTTSVREYIASGELEARP